MQKTLAEIAEIVGGEVVGDENLVITKLSGIKEATEGSLTFLANSKYTPLLKNTKASAVITPRDMELPGKSIIRTDNPSFAFATIAALVKKDQIVPIEGIHQTAVIADDAVIGDNVAIGAFAVIESNVVIKEGSIIHAGCFVGKGTEIGPKCIIHPNVTVLEQVQIGANVSIHSGSVIGSDGFGYVEINGRHQKIPQLGVVVIEDNCEIGSNVTIDRARFDKTVIGKGTKIDNLVQIAHNVIMGEDCIIIAQVGISGSTKIGRGAILAGQAGVAGHLEIGEGAIVAAQGGVTKSIPAKTKVSGYPAREHEEAKKVNACLQRLPKYVQRIKELEAKINELEKRLNDRS